MPFRLETPGQVRQSLKRRGAKLVTIGVVFNFYSAAMVLRAASRLMAGKEAKPSPAIWDA